MMFRMPYNFTSIDGYGLCYQHVYKDTYVYVCMYVCMCVCKQVCIQNCIERYTHVCMCGNSTVYVYSMGECRLGICFELIQYMYVCMYVYVCMSAHLACLMYVPVELAC
jgi:hypothetical protein